MKKVLSVVIFVSLSLVFACGGNSGTGSNNNNNNNNQSSDYFPAETGSWWKYKVSFDPSSQDYSIDSTVLSGTKLINGKDAFVFINYVKASESASFIPADTLFFYKEGPKIYRLLDKPNTKEKEWMLYANIQVEYIKIYDVPLTNYNVGGGKVLNGTEKMERNIEGPEKFTLGTQTINCIKTRVDITRSGETTDKDGNKEPFNEIFYTENQWFGYNVGFVRVFDSNGEIDKTLMDYYIAPKGK
jgi:hypothetical protein